MLRLAGAAAVGGLVAAVAADPVVAANGGPVLLGASVNEATLPGVTLTLDTTRQLTVVCNGGGSTHFIIDIAGYYL